MPTNCVDALHHRSTKLTPRQRLVAGVAGLAALGIFTTAASAADSTTTAYLSSLSIEELSNIKITSVSRQAERLSDAPASIYVITGEDIRRSGALSLAEALRLAPNLQVARVNTGAYAISARGFNNGIGNKLLVLIDGRTIYTPLFSTVNWDSQHVMLADVERIEVISGPGATLWGANAVNGVINVITRTAQNTQGNLLSAGAGHTEATATVRHGGSFGEDGYYRLYADRLNRDNSVRVNGTPVVDGWLNSQVGFRADWGSQQRGFTVQGDAYRAVADAGPLGPPELSGANLLARWTEQLSNGASFELQTYYDVTQRDDPLNYRDQANTFDIQFQHAMPLATTQKLLWGGGYRTAQGNTQTHFNSITLLTQVFMPGDRKLEWGNLFIQNEIALSPSVNVTLGLKAESNDYTGVEYLPSARFAWKPASDQLLWGALSRAVRAPARLDRDYYLYLSLPNRPLIPLIKGGPDFQSEIANVAELGYRAQPTATLSYSVTGFYSVYDKLRSGQPPPAVVQNMMEGTTHGIEAWASYQPTPDWRVSLGATGLRQNLWIKPGSRDPTGPSALGNDPEHTWQVRSAWNLGSRQQLDLTLRHVSSLPKPIVPAYTALDVRFSWQARDDMDIAVSVQNLFDTGHVEFGEPASRSEFRRNAFLKLSWRL
ncbi:MAG: TonB-dependent receptor [Pseudomonadota bacterium]